MTESVVSSKQIDESKVYPKKCPICGIETNYVYLLHETKHDEKATWYKCDCGIIFNPDFVPDYSIYNKEYIEKYKDAKKAYERYSHSGWTYAPLIEELTMGRILLDVGYTYPYNMQFFENRGWVVFGIDINPASLKGGHFYIGDFEAYDFTPQVDKKKLKEVIGVEEVKREFDLIWFGNVLERFKYPKQALQTAYDLLDETGVIFISTPDINFISKTGVPGWPHWNKKEHYTLWNERALKRELKCAGFKIIMCRRNYSSRYIPWYDLHCIAQKNYF